MALRSSSTYGQRKQIREMTTFNLNVFASRENKKTGIVIVTTLLSKPIPMKLIRTIVIIKSKI